MDVTITRITDPAELFCKYPGQFNAQPVYLELDTRDGQLSCSYNPNIGGGTTFDHHHRLILSAEIPCLTADAANTLMQEVAPLAQRVLDGADERWDGNNSVGVFTDDAANAWEEIGRICEAWSADQDPSLTVSSWDVSDWFNEGDENTIESLGITADTTDEQLDAMAAEQVELAVNNSAVGYAILDHDATLAYLTSLRDDLRQAVREELEGLVDRLTEQRDAGIRRLAAWGDSSRAIGELVGLSHTWVQRIVKVEPRALDRTGDYGILTDYVTGQEIRNATAEEHERSLAAGDTGAFELDGRAVFVAGGTER
jgi:hypothetical protein